HAHRKEAQPLLLQQVGGEMLQVVEEIVTQLGLVFAGANAVVEGKIQPQLGDGEGRDEHRHSLFVGRLQDPTLLHGFVQVLADGAVQLPGADDLFRVPSLQNVENYAFH